MNNNILVVISVFMILLIIFFKSTFMIYPILNYFHNNNLHTEINFNQDIINFSKDIQENYIYNEDYNCDYYSYVWSRYAKENDLKYTYNILTNHIFVVIEKKDKLGYYIADGNSLELYN